MKKITEIIATVLVLIACTTQLQASFTNVSLPGTSEYEGWDNLIGTNFPGYGSFPGAAAWPAPIGSTEAGSAGNVEFNKLSDNGYLAGSSVYSPFTPSLYELETTGMMLYDVETVIFQLDFGPGSGGLFFVSDPVLNINGGSQALTADLTAVTAGNNPFVNPVNPMEAGTTTAFQYQWDLTSQGTVNTFEILWRVAPHSQMYEIQVDSGDTYVEAIPEPSSFALLAAAGACLLLLRRSRGR